jgi:hypothetical protein
MIGTMRIAAILVLLVGLLGCGPSTETFTLADGDSHTTGSGVTIEYSGHHKQDMATNEVVPTTSITLRRGAAEEDISFAGRDEETHHAFGGTITIRPRDDGKVDIVWKAD